MLQAQDQDQDLKCQDQDQDGRILVGLEDYNTGKTSLFSSVATKHYKTKWYYR